MGRKKKSKEPTTMIFTVNLPSEEGLKSFAKKLNELIDKMILEGRPLFKEDDK